VNQKYSSHFKMDARNEENMMTLEIRPILRPQMPECKLYRRCSPENFFA